jgi:hypothetical protein
VRWATLRADDYYAMLVDERYTPSEGWLVLARGFDELPYLTTDEERKG